MPTITNTGPVEIIISGHSLMPGDRITFEGDPKIYVIAGTPAPNVATLAELTLARPELAMPEKSPPWNNGRPYLKRKKGRP